MTAVSIVQEASGADHFPGVEQALRARGIECGWVLVEQTPDRLAAGTRVVAVSDVLSFEPLSILRQARRLGACTVLLMDGITEYRNTFLNPNVGPDFLRPAPVDVVACAGAVDRDRLARLGNDAVVTGLPRLDAVRPTPLPASPTVLVSTARTPSFSDHERSLLVSALRALRDRLALLGAQVRWRLTGGLELELDVPPDVASLAASMRWARAVITSPSTLLVEAMKAGRPALLVHPFDAPCWPRAAWRLDAACLGSPGAIEAELASLLDPTAEDLQRQHRVLAAMHQQDPPAAEAVADVLATLVDRPRRAAIPASRLDPVRLPARRPAVTGRRRVVSLVRCDASPVGGVTTWSQRLAAAFAGRDLGYDLHTLAVIMHPSSLGLARDETTHACVVDPMVDQWKAVQTVRSAIERLEPDIVLPNYADLCFAASMQLRARGVRAIAIAHTHHETCRDVIAFYDRWDGAVGVSAACMEWLEPMAGGRPLARIVYGVPIADAPRRVDPRGPLRLAYIGRVVETQKRVGDLLVVIDGLERRAVPYVFHLVGDGEALAGWTQALGRRRLRHGRVVVHGRRSAEWVQRFLGEIDVSVLVSEFEGTSITMLESMGAGVVPAVTAVPSGVGEWVRDGINGVVVPVGEPDRMAARLAELARARDRIAAMGRAAWQTVRRDVSVDAMAERYRRLFDEVMARPMDRAPSDVGLRLHDRYTWRKEWVERPDDAMRWMKAVLAESGYRNVAVGEPGPGSDAVIVRAGAAAPVEAMVRRYRARGLGVAVWPHLIEAPVTDRMHRLALGAVGHGCRRIAIYGIGRHTRRAAGIFDRGLPLVGLIDDAPPRPRLFGLPVVTLDRALPELKPDAVLLSSDAWEPQLWRRAHTLREAGVHVIPMYGSYDADQGA